MDTKAFKILIFGGTTEGRKLSEYCVSSGISADVSVATEYGASLLPEKANKLVGRLDSTQMVQLLRKNSYSMVIDATHPYAVEATKNIKSACETANIPYYRMVRESSSHDIGAVSMEQMTDALNRSDKTILSTLGSKSLRELTNVNNYRQRIWLRLLPADDIADKCRELGFDTQKLILKKGPFSADENIEHIRLSGAQILITKDSGDIGGYNEKKIAAEKCGAELLTLKRPQESGCDISKIICIIDSEKEEQG